ncbi:MAG: excinuclease ABC subunit C [Candidatus Komeilibacteria bacterium CG_4_9_14_0_8_um_filter_36_9]|uniref:Excinuclease ABC subunit C n=1 Tax=Candidatus Komeilibacteria bacterium CG_4_9_14_0_8_um_filter_36_9 TaxID=1974473 RepID=A0A2M8DQG2_9BACT|nr:MAG: excinuclease ABC subunit C [Candidatus Komeilibacteria bacterium CG_4_9_14_0_8_um_filter_36_9]
MKREYDFYVYIMASNTGTLYVGVTRDLTRRVEEHKSGVVEGFTKKYSCNRLVYYEHFDYIDDAIEREKEIKKWRREKKQGLIKEVNPHWNDLSSDL